ISSAGSRPTLMAGCTTPAYRQQAEGLRPGGCDMATRRVVIVGGGGTGDYAAFTLRKQGFDGEITILSADRDRPYDRPYLSKEFLRNEIERPKVFLHEDADYAKERIALRLEQRVTGGSLRERTLTVDGGANVACDTLVLARGGTQPRPPGIPASENLLTLRSLRDGARKDVALGRGAAAIEPKAEMPKERGPRMEGGGERADEGLRAADNVDVASDIAQDEHAVLHRTARAAHWEAAKGHGCGIGAAI